MKSIVVTLVLFVSAVAVVPQADAKGGSGVVGAFGVGPLAFSNSPPTSVRAFGGRPDHVVFWDQDASPTTARNATWEIWQYKYPRGGYTWYSFYWNGDQSGWLLEQFDTTLQRFHTARGTRVGMTYREAKRREQRPFMGGCVDSGLWHFGDDQFGQQYALIVGVNPGGRVHALHAYGPTSLPC